MGMKLVRLLTVEDDIVIVSLLVCDILAFMYLICRETDFLRVVEDDV
jgi:hypothetical protein